jgi:predicted nucleotidyltransferase
MQFDVSERTIYLAVHGSTAYGTNTPESDLDIKGVCVPPACYYTGFSYVFEQEERMVSKGHSEDRVTYSVEKFFSLAADCNPNIIEVLFVDDSDVLKCNDLGKLMRENRDLFLSKRAKHTFSGYAHAQLHRIQTHRRWLLDASKYESTLPKRSDFDLPEFESKKDANQILTALALVQKRLDEWNVDFREFDNAERIRLQNKLAQFFVEAGVLGDDLWSRAAQAVFGVDENLIHRLQRERAYANQCSDWEKYANWKRSRNPKRAALEAKFGYDTKHGGHLIRLMRMCKEILSGQGVIVKRPDAKEILAIRNGLWSYEKLIEESEKLEAECNALYDTSALPHKPNVARLNELCSQIVTLGIVR